MPLHFEIAIKLALEKLGPCPMPDAFVMGHQDLALTAASFATAGTAKMAKRAKAKLAILNMDFLQIPATPVHRYYITRA